MKMNSNLKLIFAAALLSTTLGCPPPAAPVDVNVDTGTAAPEPANDNATMAAELPGDNVTTAAETPAAETPAEEKP